jgi:hypothetical protein
VVDVVPLDEEDESPFVGLLQVEAAQPVRHDASRRMGRGTEVAATVRLGGEVTTVTTFAVQANESAAVRALAYPVPEIEVVHARST